MIDKQIKQNALAYATENYGEYDEHDYTDHSGSNMCHAVSEKAFIAGAHSRDEEIEQLNKKCNFAIERLRKAHEEIASFRTPWISVKDKLPQLNKICFGMRDGKMPRICMLVKKKNGECVFNTPNEEYEYPKGKITHWMPIPETPKGGEV